MKTQNLAAHLPDSDDAAVARRRLAERLIEASAYDEQLPVACRDGDLELARLLLSAGADVNARDKSGETPLHRAAEEGRTDVVRLLPEAGADSEVADAGGLSCCGCGAGAWFCGNCRLAACVRRRGTLRILPFSCSALGAVRDGLGVFFAVLNLLLRCFAG